LVVNKDTGADVAADPLPISQAGGIAEEVATAIGKLRWQVATAAGPAAAHGGLHIGATLGAIVPLWEAHLTTISAVVDRTGAALRGAAGDIASADYQSGLDIRPTTGPTPA
jgi:hypothetical protein